MTSPCATIWPTYHERNILQTLRHQFFKTSRIILGVRNNSQLLDATRLFPYPKWHSQSAPGRFRVYISNHAKNNISTYVSASFSTFPFYHRPLCVLDQPIRVGNSNLKHLGFKGGPRSSPAPFRRSPVSAAWKKPQAHRLHPAAGKER